MPTLVCKSLSHKRMWSSLAAIESLASGSFRSYVSSVSEMDFPGKGEEPAIKEMPAGFNTREEWLVAAIRGLCPFLADRGVAIDIERLRVSVGWPAKRHGRAGECWPRIKARDQKNHIFVTPTIDEPVEVLAVAVHELLHAADDCLSGHRGWFRRTALVVGLTGRMTATKAGPELRERLNGVVEAIGPYPHGALSKTGSANTAPEFVGSRLLKASCPDCGYVIRVTRIWAEKGLPVCPCGQGFELEAGPSRKRC